MQWNLSSVLATAATSKGSLLHAESIERIQSLRRFSLFITKGNLEWFIVH